MFRLHAKHYENRYRSIDTAPVRTYRELFAVKEFRAVFVVQCLTVGGASIGNLALGTITYASTGSALLTSLAIFGGPIVRLVASWFLSSAADLMRPRTAMTLLSSVTCLADGLQAIPGLPWGARFVLLAMPWVAMSATGGTTLALVSEILPKGSFIFGRATLNIAVGVMQIAGYGLAGALLTTLTTTDLFVIAAAASAIAIAIVRRRISNHPARAKERNALARSHRINTGLLRSRTLRPVLLALWVPNGLIVGCESLFIPLGANASGLLYAAAAAGMLLGDITMGRFVPAATRDRLIEPLRLLLALPYLVFLLHPTVPIGAGAAFIASAGYSASLPLQERLVMNTEHTARGQVLGLNSAGLTGMQGIGAALAGTLSEIVGRGPTAASTAMGLMAIASILVTLALTRGLQRSRNPISALPER